MSNNAVPMWGHDSGSGAPDLNDDFSSFLNFGEIPIDLSSHFNNDRTGSDGTNGLTTMDTDFSLNTNQDLSISNPDQRMPTVTQAEIMNMRFHEIQKSMEVHQHAMRNYEAMVPPTPSSMELHNGLPPSILHNMSPHTMMMERFSTYREEPMIFTPLVSPAVTPLETKFTRNTPEFAIPGGFSPLTSPALTAHHHRTHMPSTHMVQGPNQMTPAEPCESPVANKKPGGRRKSLVGRNSARVVLESPSMKPQRKRAGTPLAPNLSLATALAQQIQQIQNQNRDMIASSSQHNTPIQYPRSLEESSNESVSPEPLPDVLMAPPPPPPRISKNMRTPQDDGLGTNNSHNAPVTPASLMRLPKANLRAEDIPPISMDTSEYLNTDVEIADAPSSSKWPRQNSEEMVTPIIHQNSRTPLTPSSKPSKPSKPNSAATSRHTSPLEVHNSNGPSKKEPSKGHPMRGSVHSSPALQPRISPSIKPLLPQGLSPDASALLLASKSNYQNIIEGNHSHLGLQYPEHLSTNLTSKRTSHKIAEQGRRNRINNALAEMANLLPGASGGSTSDGSVGGTGGREQTSKASTVEMAIEYIKNLTKELDETRKKLKVAEEQLSNSNDTSNGNMGNSSNHSTSDDKEKIDAA